MPWVQQQLIADGITAEGRVIVPKAILDIITNTQVATLAVNAGGTGYVVGETFELSTGTAVGLNGVNITAKGRVVSEAAGVVTGVELLSAGAYPAGTQPTATAGATTNASAAGNDDLTVDVTMSGALWIADTDNYTDVLTEFEWLATSTKASNAPTVGMQSQLNGANDGLRLQIAPGYDSGSSWIGQPGSPPTNLFYMAVPNQNPELFISITDRRVNFLVTDGTFKQYAGLGLFIPFVDVASNYPFPGIVHAQSTTVRAFNEVYSTSLNGGIVNTIDPGSGLGPTQYRDNLSPAWLGISGDNNEGADVSRSVTWPNLSNDTRYQFNFAPVPNGSGATAANMDPWNSGEPTGSFQDEFGDWFGSDADPSGPQGIAPFGPGGQVHYPVQVHILENQPNFVQPIGVVDGYERIHGRGLNNFDEIATEAGARYLVFSDTNTTALSRWVAMEKL